MLKDLNDQEKSVLLAKAMGWKTDDDALKIHLPNPLWRESGYRQNVIRNLYDPANMALAWQVLNWAWKQTGNPNNDPLSERRSQEWIDKIDQILMDYWCDSAVKAQQAWLDKIFALAVEAGLIQIDEVLTGK